MPHVRTQIRNAFRSALTGLPSTGSNVFVMRPDERPLALAELPALKIWMDDEQIAGEALGDPGTLRREVPLRVDVVAQQGAEPLADTLDAITAEVESAIAANPTLGGLVKYAEPESIATEVSAEGAAPTGRQTLGIRLCYYTHTTAPDVAL